MTGGMTPIGFLTAQGVTDEMGELVTVFTQRYQLAHHDKHHTDSGIVVYDQGLAARVFDEMVTEVCRWCDASEPGFDEDGACTVCETLKARRFVLSSRLPITLGYGDKVTCGDCGRVRTVQGHHVEVSVPPLKVLRLCRPCAIKNPIYVAWQRAADVCDEIDELMQQAFDQRQRDLIAAHLGTVASWFSRWRWPQDDSDDGNPSTD
ncbi:hypothetical protein O7626_40780 [Micromonospora sp. WMMD1102]|uniref:hypothetical protein n=1 Tax=Micromonospora sp. WMMD1102 TaxID=3016105 RepID=UPI00241517C2|nr:hypothetical protein [Micromonospora sp. WMMD1102]MDG4790386.1 hypothetical protein [Micromonospora sp. WMMD1102]MDG4792140.1 hypothetical protein [Micromonospora sp. WMMD1102]